MKLFVKSLAALVSAFCLFAGSAQAAWTYVGSWHVGDGPVWTSNPLAYSGTGAAEHLFGAGTYAISTIDSDPDHINNMAHYAIIGIGFADFAEDYFRGIEGVTHYQDVYVFDPAIDTVSTYVLDFGPGGENFAFRLDVPEPGTFALIGLGLVGLGVMRRRRQA